MRYDAILLDMDGTVLNTIEDLADAMNAALRHFGMPERSLAEVRAFVGNGAKRLVEQAVPAGTDEARRDEVLAWYKPYYDAHCQIKTRPYDGILPLLRRLRAAETIINHSNATIFISSNNSPTSIIIFN